MRLNLHDFGDGDVKTKAAGWPRVRDWRIPPKPMSLRVPSLSLYCGQDCLASIKVQARKVPVLASTDQIGGDGARAGDPVQVVPH